jgi:hypothetical protein
MAVKLAGRRKLRQFRFIEDHLHFMCAAHKNHVFDEAVI